MTRAEAKLTQDCPLLRGKGKADEGWVLIEFRK
jgi:hypothetical protein